jgi:methionyl-tRNA formyltransferase
MNILFCAYRDWAFDIIDEIDKSYFQYSVIVNNIDLKNQIIKLNPDIIFFIGWSWIIPNEIIDKYNSICVHPSKLPKYRGGSPIQNQVIDGVTSSAVTLFKMNSNLDAGDIVTQTELNLEGDLKDILNRIKTISVNSINIIINKLNKNEELIYTKQDESEATYCKRRKPEDSEITIYDLQSKTAKQLYDKIRCLQDPYPNAYITLGNNEKLYILKTKIDDSI